MRIVSLLVLLISSTALAVEIDVAPSGVIVTAAPEEGEHAAIVSDSTGLELDFGPDQDLRGMWLIHPGAWRKAVAMAERVAVLEALPDEQSAIITGLEADLTESRGFHSETRLQLEAVRAEVKVLKKSRTKMVISSLVTGVIAGAAGVAVIAF